MNRFAWAFAAVLIAGIAVIWAPEYLDCLVTEAGIFALFGIFCAACARSQARLRFHWLALPVLLIALWPVAQLLLHATAAPAETLVSALFWGAAAAAFVLSLQILSVPAVRRQFWNVLAVAGVAIAFLAILQKYTSPGRVFWLFPASGDLIGPFLYKNQFAAFLELLFPVAVERSIRDRERSLAWIAAAALMFAGVVISASRAGVVLLAAELVAVLFLAWLRRWLTARSFVLLLAQALAFCAIFTAVAGWQTTWSRFQEQTGTPVRRQLWTSTARMIAEHPLTGTGLGTWWMFYPCYATFDNVRFANHAHNDWLQWTAEAGVFFSALLLILAVTVAWKALQHPWGLGAVAVFIHSWGDYPTSEPVLIALLFALCASLAVAAPEPEQARNRHRTQRAGRPRSAPVTQ